MKESFKHQLQEQHVLAGTVNEVAGLDESFMASEDFDLFIQSQVEALSHEASPLDIQVRIFDLQRQKDSLMKWLYDQKDSLNLDSSFALPETLSFSHNVICEDGILRVGDSAISEGDMMAALEWDIYFNLDDPSIDLGLKKRYIGAIARHLISRLLDRQIALSESHDSSNREGTRNAYAASLESNLDSVDTMPQGIIAEKMVQSFLAKLVVDKDLPFKIQSADLYQDVHHKIDFIIQKTDHVRGVGVDAHDEGEHMRAGIQFTLNKNHDKQSLKERQLHKARGRILNGDIRDIDDIMLVTLSSSKIRSIISDWKQEDNPLSGPEAYLDTYLQRDILRTTLKELYSSHELEEIMVSAFGQEEALGVLS